jgi:hypothetical protein
MFPSTSIAGVPVSLRPNKISELFVPPVNPVKVKRYQPLPTEVILVEIIVSPVPACVLETLGADKS